MQIQAITNRNNYKIQYPRFMGRPKVATKPIQVAADSFVRSAEKPIFGTIRDIKNYLKINVDKIKDGEIFNTPITKDGDSLLMAFLHIKPIEEEEEEYESLLYKMEKMPKINYDQKDSMDMTALEWMMSAENFALLDLMKDKKLTQDPMTHTTYKHIKNPEFRKALVESGVYKPMFETLKNTMEKYSLLKYSLYDRTEYWRSENSGRMQMTHDHYQYKSQEVETFKDLFNYFEYGTENFKENKNEFLKTIRPFVANFIGFFDKYKLNEYDRDHTAVHDLDLEQAHKNLINLYYMTGGNKQFYKDILIDVFKNEKGARMFDFQDIYTLKEIYKDNLDDFIDILLAMGEKNEFIEGNHLDECRNLLEELKHDKISKAKLKNLYDALSWHDKNRYDTMRADISRKIDAVNNKLTNKLTLLKTVTDYLSKNKSKINDGEIFNLPMPETGVTPLVTLTKVVLNEGEEQDLQILFKEMKNMPKIDFNQVDENGESFIEHVFYTENDTILPVIPKDLLYDYKFEAAFDGIKNKDFKNKVQKLYLFQNNSKNADWIGQSAYFNSKLLKSPGGRFVTDEDWNDIGKYAVENDVEGIRSVAERGFDINAVCKDSHNWGPHFFYSSSIYSIANYYKNNDVINYLKKFPHFTPTGSY